jgi:3D (Asp-Asp-Asp) domain-containing protein
MCGASSGSTTLESTTEVTSLVPPAEPNGPRHIPLPEGGMNQSILTTVLLLSLSAATFAREQSLLARVTVYWASGGCSDAGTRSHQCSTGARLRRGHCAVDPKKIPYGSKVIFPDATCVAVDTGPDVINRKAARHSGETAGERSAIVVDRFFETKDEAMGWANAHPHFMTLRVESPNDTESRPRLIARHKAPVTGPVTYASASARVIRRPSSVVLSQITAIPQKKLVADNRDYNRLTLSRRF